MRRARGTGALTPIIMMFITSLRSLVKGSRSSALVNMSARLSAVGTLFTARVLCSECQAILEDNLLEGCLLCGQVLCAKCVKPGQHGACLDYPAESELESVVDAPIALGITGDRQGGGGGAKQARGHSVNLRQLNSRQVHESFLHKPVEVLRELPKVCHDVPKEWEQLLDLNEACPDCLGGKHTHFGSHSGLPEVSRPGEIVAFDLLILRTPDLYTNGTIIFGAIDLYSDWDLITKIKFKTDVPECLKEVHGASLQVARPRRDAHAHRR